MILFRRLLPRHAISANKCAPALILLPRRIIPYRVRSGVRFFEQAHIKDVISYLRIIVNPRDELAWKRILKMIPGVGNKTENRIYESIGEQASLLAMRAKPEMPFSESEASSAQDLSEPSSVYATEMSPVQAGMLALISANLRL